MNKTRVLLNKEFKLEFRQKHNLAGVGLFVISAVFICYLSFEELNEPKVLSALLWLVGLFAAFHAMAKTFFSEGQGTQLYLYSIARPADVILSKSIFNAIQVAALNLFSLLLFLLFFGTNAIEKADMLQLITGLILGSTGLGISLTLVSGIAYKASNNLGLMAILGFPVIIPLLLTVVRFSDRALQGLTWENNALNLVILLVLNVSSAILSVVLFPYLWRD